jgi:hypothetical protein
MDRVCRLLVVAVTLTVGMAVANEEKEEEIALSEVPEKVVQAAQNAVPGIRLTEAEVERTREGLVYELEGTLAGKSYEIEVSADGKVLEVEEGADDGEDEGEGDKGDDKED